MIFWKRQNSGYGKRSMVARGSEQKGSPRGLEGGESMLRDIVIVNT